MAVPKKKKSKKKKSIRFKTWKQKIHNWKTKAFGSGMKILKKQN
uniref:Ribosomal protein L32 n=1 Tax=Codium arabicum TaxID=221038 RepID=A0A386B0N3_CODAR|nr:ribosomal protein L32 [Codium arabicum]AYC65254.1 ribosomal protein L32 [Codium arabicum]